MSDELPVLPGWTFDLVEVRFGVYLASVVDSHGRRCEHGGFDPEELLERCRQWALEVSGA